MSQSANLLAAAVAKHTEEMPATIQLRGETYTAATGGITRSQEFGEFGAKTVRRITFWIQTSAFTAASQPLPVESEPVTVTAPERLAGAYTISEIAADGTGTVLLLHCRANAQ